MLSKTNGCQPLCFISLSTSMFYRSTLQPAPLISQNYIWNYTHFSPLSPHSRWHDISFPRSVVCVSSWHVIFITLQNIFVLYKIFWWIARKKLYAINWKVLNRLIKSESLKGKKITEYYWCNLTLIIMDCEWIGKFFIISLNISWGLLGVGRPCNFAITEQKI